MAGNLTPQTITAQETPEKEASGVSKSFQTGVATALLALSLVAGTAQAQSPRVQVSSNTTGSISSGPKEF